MNLKDVTQEQLDEIAHRLNSRPRRTLEFMTPSRKLSERMEALQLAEREDREVVDRSPHFGRRRSHHVANHVSVRLDVDDDDTDDGPVAREQEAVSH